MSSAADQIIVVKEENQMYVSLTSNATACHVSFQFYLYLSLEILFQDQFITVSFELSLIFVKKRALFRSMVPTTTTTKQQQPPLLNTIWFKATYLLEGSCI